MILNEKADSNPTEFQVNPVPVKRNYEMRESSECTLSKN